MICENCKRNEANIHMKRIINASATEVHLCGDCAKALGYGGAFSGFGLGLGDLFGNFLSHTPTFSNTAAVRCSMCGNSFRDIAESGRFGCAECYETFYDKVLPSIERIHGQTKHVGKRVNKEDKDAHYITDTEDLKRQLDKAVEEQNYELAAELRDKIKENEKRENKKDGEEKTDE